MMDETAAAARRLAAMQQMALVVALERAGGKMTFTQSEYQSIVERHGGSSLMAVHAELLATPGQEADEVRVSLITKAPGQGELLA